MSKQVYISADYDEDGDREVVDELIKWAKNDRLNVNFRKILFDEKSG